MSFILNDKKKIKSIWDLFWSFKFNSVYFMLCFKWYKKNGDGIILIFVFSIFWWIWFFCLYDMYVIFVVIENGNIIKVCIK